MAYIDPGNWATDLEAGASYGYKLLFVVLLAGLAAIGELDDERRLLRCTLFLRSHFALPIEHFSPRQTMAKASCWDMPMG